ncbi:MAG: hypothetical protein R3C69_18260 [Geminicoccaceae bacterium]
MSTGRNFDEILRIVDLLQLTARHQVATPANWNQATTSSSCPRCPTRRPRPSSRTAGRPQALHAGGGAAGLNAARAPWSVQTRATVRCARARAPQRVGTGVSPR